MGCYSFANWESLALASALTPGLKRQSKLVEMFPNKSNCLFEGHLVKTFKGDALYTCGGLSAPMYYTDF